MPRFTVILLLISFLSSAQPKRFEHYTIPDGLSQSTVRAIVQDETGFIWMGTQDGLNRFDGKLFKTLRKTSKGEASLSNNNVTQLIVSHDKKLWIGTLGGGVNIYNSVTDSIMCIRQNPGNEKTLVDNNVLSLLQTSLGEIWAGSENGITIVDPTSLEVKIVIQQFHVNPIAISSLAQDDSDRIWAATRHDGVYIFDAVSKKQLHHISKGTLGLSSQSVDPVRHIFRDRSAKIWISTNKGLYMHAKETDSFELKKIALRTVDRDFTNEVITCCMEDRNGNFWIGTHNGVLIREKNSELYQHYNQNINNPYGLSDRAIISIYEDRDGIIWIGTYNGVNKFVNKALKFRSYKFDIQDRYKNLQVVRSLYTEDDNEIFVGTVNSLLLFNRNTETIQYIKDESGHNLQDVFCIAKDDDGELWAANTNGFQKISKRLSGYRVVNAKDHPELDIFKTAQVTRCIPIGHDNYLMGTFTESGLFLWNKKKRTVTNFLPESQNKNSIEGNKVNQIFISREGKIWIATNRGISELDFANRVFKNFRPGLQVINAVAEDKNKNIIWLASNGGLVEFNWLTQESKVYTEDDGLANNTLYSCLSVNDSILWMSSNKGISEFNTKTREFTNYDVADGLQSNEYNQYAWHVSKTGKLYFGGMEGFDVVTSSPIPHDRSTPLVVTNIRVIEKNKFANLYPMQNQPLQLRYFQNAIGFDYALLDFSSPGRNEFLCKLEGFDEGWIDNEKNTSISYTNLPPGDYLFQVKTKENTGKNITSYAFTILAPFWQTRWFTLAVVSLTLAFIALIIRSYYKRKLEKQRLLFEKQQAVAQERTRIATDMHDDLGAGLSRIKFLSESIGIKTLQRELVTEDIDKIRQYSHDMIDKMGEIVWALNQKNDSLSDLISYTRSYAAEYLEQNNIACSIITPDEVPPLMVTGEFRRNLFLVVKEALHNIVKHAKAEHVTMDIVVNQKLFITLTDNGRGFDVKTARRAGNGLSNMHSRMKDVAGGLEIKNENGTSVRLWAPLPL